MMSFKLIIDGQEVIDYQKYINENMILPNEVNNINIPVDLSEVRRMFHRYDPGTTNVIGEGELHFQVERDTDLSIEGALNKYRPDAFQEQLARFMNERKIRPSRVYNIACISRQLFSLMFSYDNDYKPKKENIFKVIIALRLNLSEAEMLMNAKGYTISEYDKFDILMRYFIEHNIYDTNIIDEQLHKFCDRVLFSVGYD